MPVITTEKSHLPVSDSGKMVNGVELKEPNGPKGLFGFFKSLLKAFTFPVLAIPAIVGCAFMYAACKIGDAMLVHYKRAKGEIQDHHHSKTLQAMADFFKTRLFGLTNAAFVDNWVGAVSNVCSCIREKDHATNVNMTKSEFFKTDAEREDEAEKGIYHTTAVSSPTASSVVPPAHSRAP